MPSWLISLGVVATVVVAAWAHGWTTGAGHEQDKAQALAQAALSEQAAQFDRAIAARDGVDSQYQESLSNVQAEHDRLASGINRGDYRVYIKARCPVSNTGTPSSPDAERAELDPADGQHWNNLRAGIQRKETLITGLQAYISTVCSNNQGETHGTQDPGKHQAPEQ